MAVAKELVVCDRRGGNRSACVGLSQGWVSNQVTSDDDVIDVHSNTRVFSWLNVLYGTFYLPVVAVAVSALAVRLCSPHLSRNPWIPFRREKASEAQFFFPKTET